MTSRNTVLIIEPDISMAQWLRDVVSTFGFEPLVTESPLVALVVAAERAPRLVIYGAEAVTLSAASFIRLLRANGVTAGIPVILFGDVVAAQSVGAVAAFSRAADASEIVAALAELLGAPACAQI